MKLADYESLVDRVERGEIEGTSEAIEVRMFAVARQCRTSLWRTEGIKAEAAAIANRAEAIAIRLEPVTASRNHTAAEKTVGTYARHVGWAMAAAK